MEAKTLYVALIITIGFMTYAYIYHTNIKRFEYLVHTRLNNLVMNLSSNYEALLRQSQIKPRYIYIDMGTNDADSILSFFGMSKNGYPPLLNQTFIEDKEWIVYAFEPNPKHNKDIYAAKEKILQRYPKVKFNVYTETAIWTYNGVIKFYISDRGNSESSSLKISHQLVKKQPVNVTCINVVDFLKQFNQEDVIVAKIDIEGAEYELLGHMIVNNVLGLIDYLGVEYHNIMLDKTPESLITSENMLDYIIQKSNIKLIKWI